MPKVAHAEVEIRVLRTDDFPSIMEIDTQVRGRPRPEYYERKMRTLMDGSGGIVSSLAAEVDGKVVGFLMGQVFDGEFGIPETAALIDTVGVNPELQRSGIARLLFEEFCTNMKAIGVTRIRTLVDWNAWDLITFFDSMGFEPLPVLNLELEL
jgi:ribosomal protein S18 acetylase RimI-like enzyme